ncbi:MAG: hypothetical protein KDK12_14425 [Rhodobacteraceae bacterium]|nr:hypothetical protein [Paracoccaceae bacterium]
MQITFCPVRGLPGQPETVLSVSGDVLTCDGIAYDLSTVPEGGCALPEGVHPFQGPILREDATLKVTLRVVLGDDAMPEQPGDAAFWTLNANEGAVAIPALRLTDAGAEHDSPEETE